MGSYSGNISADSLTMNCKRNVKPEMAETKGKRLLIAAELEEGTRLNTSIVKQLCSTDSIFAEKKYKDPFSFTPSHTLVLYTNHLPRVGAKDTGIWRRLIVIPFKAKIEGKSDIKNYTEYLCENAGEAVMKWMIEGARQAIELGFKLPFPDASRTPSRPTRRKTTGSVTSSANAAMLRTAGLPALENCIQPIAPSAAPAASTSAVRRISMPRWRLRALPVSGRAPGTSSTDSS